MFYLSLGKSVRALLCQAGLTPADQLMQSLCACVFFFSLIHLDIDSGISRPGHLRHVDIIHGGGAAVAWHCGFTKCGKKSIFASYTHSYL